MSLSFFRHADGWRFFVTRKKDKAQRARKDKHICDVEYKRVIDATTGHVQKVENITVNKPVHHIGERPAHQEATTDVGANALI